MDGLVDDLVDEEEEFGRDDDEEGFEDDRVLDFGGPTGIRNTELICGDRCPWSASRPRQATCD